MENANDNGVEKAMKTKPLYEIEADLDRLENATGDVTLTGEPPEEPLVSPLECIIDRINFMLDPNPWPEVIKAGCEAKILCRELIHLAHLSELVEKSKAASSECPCCEPWPTPQADPQSEAQAAGLAAVEQAIPDTETPTDAA